MPPSDISGQTWADYEDSAAKFVDPQHAVKLVELVRRAAQKKYLGGVSSVVNRHPTVETTEQSSRERAAHDEAINSLRVEVATAHARAAEANEKAEREKVERLKIEEKLKPRTINEDQRIKLIVALGADTITGNSVEIFSLSTDDEAVRLRESLREIFNSAGWKAQSNLNRKVVGHPVGGLLIEINPGAGESTRRAAARLVAALKEVGLDASGPESSYAIAGNAPIEIIVGSKP